MRPALIGCLGVLLETILRKGVIIAELKVRACRVNVGVAVRKSLRRTG